jgi:glucose/arabinose dehydrogenase
VVRVPLQKTTRASGEYEDFLTGFVTRGGDVWGRPVGVTVAADGALLVTDDGGNCIWRVSYDGR